VLIDTYLGLRLLCNIFVYTSSTIHQDASGSGGKSETSRGCDSPW